MPTDLEPTAVDPGTETGHRLRWRGILHSEWVRLVTTRSTWLTLVATGAVMAILGLVAATVSAGSDEGATVAPPGFAAVDGVGTLLAGSTPVVLIVGVLGVMLGAREYATGMVRTTYAAVPRRWRVLAARIAVFSCIAVPVLLAGIAVAFVGGNAVLDAAGAATVAWSDEGVPRAVLGTAAYLVGTGVLGICFGTLTRGIGSGVGIVVALFMVLPGLGGLLLPDDWSEALAYLPSQAGASFTSVEAGADYLSVGGGAAVFATWIVLAALAAGTALVRRDV